jgi:hypothetical protein
MDRKVLKQENAENYIHIAKEDPLPPGWINALDDKKQPVVGPREKCEKWIDMKNVAARAAAADEAARTTGKA